MNKETPEKESPYSLIEDHIHNEGNIFNKCDKCMHYHYDLICPKCEKKPIKNIDRVLDKLARKLK